MTAVALDRPSSDRIQKFMEKTADASWQTSPPVVLTRSQAVRPVGGKAGRRTVPVWLLLTGAVLASLVGATGYQRWQARAAQAAAIAGHVASPRLVRVDRPALATESSVVLPATLRPWASTSLHARVSGYLAAWHKDLGQRVVAGEVLAEIETPELDQELAEGEALALEAAAAAVQARAERNEARADLKVAEAQLVRIQAENELAKSQLTRREKLLASRAVSHDDYDTFATQVESRTAEVAAAKSDVIRRRANLDTRAAIIEAREATAKSRRSNVDRLKELQTFKRIVAPFDGVITRRAAEIGMLVTAGKESLFTLEDTHRIRVQINVPQTYSAQTAAGVEVAINLPESNRPPVVAKVTRVAESVDSVSRTMLAEIELDNAAHRFQPGSYAQVSLSTPQDHSAWTVPTSTVSMRVDGPTVAVVDAQNKIQIRRVTLGRDLGSRVLVTQGIQGDERLVVHPGDRLSGGENVQVEGDRAAAEVAGV